MQMQIDLLGLHKWKKDFTNTLSFFNNRLYSFNIVSIDLLEMFNEISYIILHSIYAQVTLLLYIYVLHFYE